MSAHRALGQRGFTLLEVMVSVTVLALMVGALYSAFHVGARSWEAGAARTDSSGQMRVVQRFLQQYLTQARPVVITDQGPWYLDFEGRKEELHFITDMPPRLGVGGLYGVRMRVEGNQNDKRLVLERRLWHPELDAEAGPGVIDDSVLIDDLADVEFAYYGSQRGDPGPRWYDRWVKEQTLPDLVRIRVQSRESGEWPELTAALRLQSVRLYATDLLPGPEDKPTEAEPQRAMLPEHESSATQSSRKAPAPRDEQAEVDPLKVIP